MARLRRLRRRPAPRESCNFRPPTVFYPIPARPALSLPPCPDQQPAPYPSSSAFAASAAGRAKAKPRPNRAPAREPGPRRWRSARCVAQALAKNFSVRIQTYSVDQAKAGVDHRPVRLRSRPGRRMAEVRGPESGAGHDDRHARGSAARRRRATTRARRPRSPSPSSPGGTVTANYALSREGTNSVHDPLPSQPRLRGQHLAQRHPAPAPGGGHRLQPGRHPKGAARRERSPGSASRVPS